MCKCSRMAGDSTGNYSGMGLSGESQIQVGGNGLHSSTTFESLSAIVFFSQVALNAENLCQLHSVVWHWKIAPNTVLLSLWLTLSP